MGRCFLRKKSPFQNPSSQRRVVGIHACEEALRVNPQWVQELWVMEGKERELASLLELSSKQKLQPISKGKKAFKDLPEGSQGVAVVLGDRPRWQDSWAQKEESLVVFLDGITDPHNLGAILRTAWLLGVDGLFIPQKHRVDLTPVVCKVASGGAEHIPVEACHFGSQISWFKEQGYWVYGLREKGEGLAQQNLRGKKLMVIGSEGRGLRRSTEGFCDHFVSLPQVESGSSFNASVAFALGVYECQRPLFMD